MTRTCLASVAAQGHLPVENLVSPDLVRRIAWTPPVPADDAAVAAALRAGGARTWQITLVTPALVTGLAATAADVAAAQAIEAAAIEAAAVEPEESATVGGAAG